MTAPRQVTFYLYAEDDAQVQALQRELNAFVRAMYGKGRLVTASGLSDALRKYGGSPLVSRFFNAHKTK